MAFVTLPRIVNAHLCLTIHCEFFHSSFIVQTVYRLGLFLTQFQGSPAKTGEDQKEVAGMMKTKLRISFYNFVKLKSSR